jgi:hypothetical protein
LKTQMTPPHSRNCYRQTFDKTVAIIKADTLLN